MRTITHLAHKTWAAILLTNPATLYSFYATAILCTALLLAVSL